MGMPASQVTVKLDTVEFKSNSAVASVSVIPNGQPEAAGMKIGYQLQYKDAKWTVTGRPDSGGGHGTVPPPGADPHGGAIPGGAAAPGATPTMPSPDSLPPAKKSGSKQ